MKTMRQAVKGQFGSQSGDAQSFSLFCSGRLRGLERVGINKRLAEVKAKRVPVE